MGKQVALKFSFEAAINQIINFFFFLIQLLSIFVTQGTVFMYT